MPSSFSLTDEQRAVVRHRGGPAVVRAVPGAGKTTVVAHRIRHLVEERDVAPDRILATSFSRETVRDLAETLRALGVRDVEPQTLHALGLSLLRAQAPARVHPEDAPGPGTAARILARRALTDLAAERNLDTTEIGISARELSDQVAAWKQQLAYPDPDAADLSGTAREKAQTATHDNEDFVALYRRFERHRGREGWLTYADMLREGWAALAQNEDLRTRAQNRYRHVLVDEFQDVSRVQALLLDRLTAQTGAPDTPSGTENPRRYMVVGDADQCIYGWRGADPSFLVHFHERYDATPYPLTDSFRLPAAPLVLANAVIQNNETRPPKRLRLTRGVEGTTELLTADGAENVASRIAGTAERLRERGYALDDIAVLVRTYGQTPPLEQAFLERDLRYRIQGQSPFYRRREVQTLLRYLYWAVLERRRRKKGWFSDPDEGKRYTDRFAHVLKTPNRYVQHGRIDRVLQETHRRKESVLDVLRDHLGEMPDRTAERVEDFLAMAEALIDRLDAPPADTLDWLIDAVDYEAALRERSAFTARGDARVQTARALIRFAEPYASTPALLRGIRTLANERHRRTGSAPALDVRSIHRAKGAEWPVVFVPGCTEGTLPLAPGGERDLDEERRLFYVALTRPRDHLFLGTDTSEARSRFLEEAEVEPRLDALQHIHDGLTAPPASLSDEAVGRLCREIVHLDLVDYIQDWWSPSEEHAAALRDRLAALRPAVDRATERRNAHRQRQAEHTARRQEIRATVRDRVQGLRAEVGDAPLTATNEQPETYYPTDARFTFSWTDDASQVGVFWDDTRVGTLDPLGARRLDAQTVLDLPWDQIVGCFETVARGRDVLRFTIDWAATASTLQEETLSTLSPPDSPSEKTTLLTDDAFHRGYTLLRDALSSGSPS